MKTYLPLNVTHWSFKTNREMLRLKSKDKTEGTSEMILIRCQATKTYQLFHFRVGWWRSRDVLKMFIFSPKTNLTNMYGLRRL